MGSQANIRNGRYISRKERRDIRRHNQLTGFLEYDANENWQICEVRLQGLRIAHGDFRSEPLKKGELMSIYLDTVRGRIEVDDYPFSKEISSRWLEKPPIYVIRTTHNGELYVYDGQKRTLNACYNDEEWMAALVVDTEERREVL